MSEQWGFYFDPNRCLGCHACAISCKQRNGVAADDHVEWRRVEYVRSGTFPDFEEAPVSVSCMHCADPACVRVCPANAITKRGSDGIVVVDPAKCIGCGYCGWACPFGAPQYASDGTMQKCHLCLGEGADGGVDRPARKTADEGGREPACVSNCVGGALRAGPRSELTAMASEEAVAQFRRSDGSNVVVEPLASTSGTRSASDESSASDETSEASD
jgi:anaerobic dimethyl sulfoxide reductase subunit B (iron-sulfur subunit)